MLYFIKLTLFNEATFVHINISKIEAIVSQETQGTVIHVEGDADSFYRVKETPDQIFALMPAGVR